MAATASSGGASDEEGQWPSSTTFAAWARMRRDMALGHAAAKANVVEEGHEESNEEATNCGGSHEGHDFIATNCGGSHEGHEAMEKAMEANEITESDWEELDAMDPQQALREIKKMDGAHNILRKRLRTGS